MNLITQKTHIILMKEILYKSFSFCNHEVELAIDQIYGMTQCRKTSSTALSPYVRGEIAPDSKNRAIERFRQNGTLQTEEYLEALRKLFERGLKREEKRMNKKSKRIQKVVLSFDRTNWEYGETSINAFVAFASGENISAMIALKMLDNKGGNSNSDDRINLAKEVVQRYGKERIQMMLGDREFFSVKFATWLVMQDVRFVIRVRENLDFLQEYLKHKIKKEGRIFRDVLIGEYDGYKLRCDLSIKRLADEWLIVVSHKVKNPLQAYRKRWRIESFFRMLKTGGFNIEDTKITSPKRLCILFLMCAIAHIICAAIGIYWHENIKPVRWKPKDECYEFSFFRYGIDQLRTLIITDSDSICNLIARVFTHV